VDRAWGSTSTPRERTVTRFHLHYRLLGRPELRGSLICRGILEVQALAQYCVFKRRGDEGWPGPRCVSNEET
jgi:hypothetical protein